MPNDLGLLMKSIIVLTAAAFYLFFSKATFAVNINVTVYALHDYPPYSYKDDKEIKGIYTKILREAFSRMKGYDVFISATPWKRGLKYLEQGNGFALYPPYYRPIERPYIHPYSVPILEEKVVVFCSEKILQQSRPNWPEDYYGLTIGNNSGYKLGGEKFWKVSKEGKIKIEETDGNLKNILKLGAGRTDCYINDRLSILWELNRLKKSGEYKDHYTKIKEGPVISSEQGFLGFTDRDNGRFYFKNDFVMKFNSIMIEMKTRGEVQKIINNYEGLQDESL